MSLSSKHLRRSLNRCPSVEILRRSVYLVGLAEVNNFAVESTVKHDIFRLDVVMCEAQVMKHFVGMQNAREHESEGSFRESVPTLLHNEE